MSSLPDIHEVDENDYDDGGGEGSGGGGGSVEGASGSEVEEDNMDDPACRLRPDLNGDDDVVSTLHPLSDSHSHALGESSAESDDPSSEPVPNKQLTLKGVLKHIRRGNRNVAMGIRGFVGGRNMNNLGVPQDGDGFPGAPRQGRRKSSIFGNVLRRVSIHRRESSPSNRIATFFFGSGNKSDDSDASDSHHEEEAEDGDAVFDEEKGEKIAMGKRHYHCVYSSCT
jgi:hypothetical protein